MHKDSKTISLDEYKHLLRTAIFHRSHTFRTDPWDHSHYTGMYVSKSSNELLPNSIITSIKLYLKMDLNSKYSDIIIDKVKLDKNSLLMSLIFMVMSKEAVCIDAGDFWYIVPNDPRLINCIDTNKIHNNGETYDKVKWFDHVIEQELNNPEKIRNSINDLKNQIAKLEAKIAQEEINLVKAKEKLAKYADGDFPNKQKLGALVELIQKTHSKLVNSLSEIR